jgi:hypothetical protein
MQADKLPLTHFFLWIDRAATGFADRSLRRRRGRPLKLFQGVHIIALRTGPLWRAGAFERRRVMSDRIG